MKSVRFLVFVVVFIMSALQAQAGQMDPVRKLMYSEQGLTVKEVKIETENPSTLLNSNRVHHDMKITIKANGVEGFQKQDNKVFSRVTIDFLDAKGTPLAGTSRQSFDPEPFVSNAGDDNNLSAFFTVRSDLFKNGETYLVRVSFEDIHSPKSIMTLFEFAIDNAHSFSSTLQENKTTWRDGRIIAISTGNLDADQFGLWNNGTNISNEIATKGAEFEAGFKGFKGFAIKEGKFYPSCTLQVYGANGTKLGDLGDLYANDKDGVSQDGHIKVYVNINSIFESGKQYFMILNITDKNGDPKNRLAVSVPFTVQ